MTEQMMKEPHPYKKLKLQYDIPQELEQSIDDLLYHIRYEDGHLEDCYRTEIDCNIRFYRDRLPPGEYERLRDYYVRGGIYEEIGKPWKT